MTTGKRGRPRKNNTEKSGKITMTAPVERIAMAHTAGYSNSLIYQTFLEAVTEAMNYGVELPELRKGSTASRERLINTLKDALLANNEAYRKEQIREAEIVARKNCEHAEEFKTGLIELLIHERRGIKDDKLDSKNALRWFLNKYSDMNVTNAEVLKYMTTWADGRKRSSQDKPRFEEEIRGYVEMLVETPTMISSGERISITLDNN